MQHPLSANGLRRLARLVSLTAALGAAWIPLNAPAQETALPNPTLETLEQLQHQLEALRARAQGMEGKLKESALARKSADQARMDAERRLAASTQELDTAQTQLQALKTRLEALAERLTDQQTLVAQFETALQVERTRNQALASRIVTLSQQVPEADGGTLSAEAARQAAAAAFALLNERVDNPESAASLALVQTREAAEATLHRRQFELAYVTNADGVYRVRPRDTLALISSRFYGTSAQWRVLFEANRHVLADPDRLAPGLTLVIPLINASGQHENQ